MRALWFGRALIGLADVLVLRCTTRGSAGPFPPVGKGGGHSFAVAVGMTLFSMAFNGAMTPANRLALSGLAERARLTHVPVQLSQVTSLVRRMPSRLGQDDPRNVWAITTKVFTPSASEATSLACTKGACALVDGSTHRSRSHPDFESYHSTKPEGLAPYEPDFDNHPDLHAGVGVSSDQLPSVSDHHARLAQELVAAAIARAIEDATS